MPAPKQPKTFDQHLGQVINGLARPLGGRPYLAELLNLSQGTIDRRMAGDTPTLARELELIAPALHTTAEAIVAQALRNYGGGDAEAGRLKLARENAAMSAPVISLDARRKTPATMTDDELEAERNAASTDPEHQQDEPDTP